MAHRNAASVLPDPVGAASSALCPLWIAGQPRACTLVGAPNAERNHASTAG